MDNIVGQTIGIYEVQYLCGEKAKDGHKLYHTKCTQCGFESNMLKSHIRENKKCNHKKEIVINQCKQCGKDIPLLNTDTYSAYKVKKFCCQSCAATYNNKKRNTKQSSSAEKFCIACGNPCRNKYCSVQCQAKHKHQQLIDGWLSGDIEIATNKWGDTPESIRKYLFEKYNSKCSRCGWGETNPHTNKVPLEVEHIDGNYKNNNPGNLTLLCPNCHSLTKAYRGANKGNGRPKTWRPKEE
jgi:hypothetical protein